MASAAYDRKRLITILAIGGVLVAALGIYALTSGGGGGGGSSAGPTTTTRSSATAASQPRRTTPTTRAPVPTTTTTVATMPQSFETFAERNPFEPSVQTAGTGTGTGGTGTGTTPTTVAGAGTTPTTAATGGTGGTGATGGTGGTGGTNTGGTGGAGAASAPPAGSQNPTGGTPVQLVQVIPASNQAVVQVGSTAYTVTPGQTFATSYKLVSLSGSCGQFLFGDSPFSLCTGEQVLK
jgi:hypothetical protein